MAGNGVGHDDDTEGFVVEGTCITSSWKAFPHDQTTEIWGRRGIGIKRSWLGNV